MTIAGSRSASGTEESRVVSSRILHVCGVRLPSVAAEWVGTSALRASSWRQHRHSVPRGLATRQSSPRLPQPKGQGLSPLLDTHEGADRSTPVVIQQRTSDAATGSLRPSHEPGGGPEQPVKPGRLGALYTRDVRNSSASGSPARVAERSGKLKERIPPSPPVSKCRHDFWGWRRCVRFSGFRGLDQDQSQPARGTGWRVGRASRRSPVRGRVRSASPGGPGRGPLAGCR